MAFTRAMHSGQFGTAIYWERVHRASNKLKQTFSGVWHSSRSSQICCQWAGNTILEICSQNLGISSRHMAGSPAVGQTSATITSTIAWIASGLTENIASPLLALAQSSQVQVEEVVLRENMARRTCPQIWFMSMLQVQQHNKGNNKTAERENIPSWSYTICWMCWAIHRKCLRCY